ncbi:MAG: hypothetical protein D6707_12110 [Bacteroidetes bacterium]|nr:MAG: hypothetical protein D6707_12110 [Bacteroidota bacterium]
MTKRELADMLMITDTAINQYICQGALTAVKIPQIGKRARWEIIEDSKLVAFIEKRMPKHNLRPVKMSNGIEYYGWIGEYLKNDYRERNDAF